jgi:hypothetical protein
MSAEHQRTCPSCVNEFSGAMEFCPVCMLRRALPGAAESGASFDCEDTVKPTSGQPAQRFGHYELVTARLEVKLALEIISQVAAGLEAVHEQKLVHRDIKPTNIMVRLKDDGRVTAKIIDLGLAKGASETGAESAISTLGVFAGTPEFASPEQFAGVGVDIRSDLYSLGVTLWQMLTGKAPFRGTPCEVMHQHQHAPLPLDLLEDVPQLVVVLLEVLLEKDPARRFQDPAEILRAIPTITDALDARRRITRQSLQKAHSTTSRVVTRKPPAKRAPKKISIARLPVTGSDLFGREEDIAFVDRAWAKKEVNVVTIVAWAGVGKSTLVNHWLRRMAAKHYHSAELVFGWSFYRQAPAARPRLPMNFLMQLSPGSAIRIRGSEPGGRRVKDSRSSSRITGHY